MRINFILTGGTLLAVLAINTHASAAPKLNAAKASTPFHATDSDGGRDLPLKLVGERLFRETRFSQYFQANAKGQFNQLPAQGDAVVADLETLTAPIAHPYQGQSISCAACHFVDQAQPISGGGQRAYTDFARRSPVPDRGDGLTHTARNSPNMVGSSLKDQFFLHWDGEFASPQDLIASSLTGRNMGWKDEEFAAAKKHIVDVIRADDGSFPTETGLSGLSYRHLFAGDSAVPARFLIPRDYRLNIDAASDEQVFNGVVSLITGYLHAIDFKKGPDQLFMGSPFNMFLRKNHFPRLFLANETAAAYTGRVLQAINATPNAELVSKDDFQFQFHSQDFTFQEKELAGLRIFTGRGQCIACHAFPEFTDHLFHNTGVSQLEYDGIHGTGSFLKLAVPSLSERLKNFDQYLPSSPEHPRASSRFRSEPRLSDPTLADLGAWNVFGNPAMPNPQTRIRQAICDSVGLDCKQTADDAVLAASLGIFKTPTLRALGLSQPYLHTGQADTIEDVIHHYVAASQLARKGLIRNADPKLATIQISDDDVPALAAFLRSLNEDYN